MRYTPALVRSILNGPPLMGFCFLFAALFLSSLGLAEPAACSGELSEPADPFRIGGRPVHGQGGGFRACPSAAFDGTNYFVVWADGRCGSVDIYGSRVTASGTVLDLEGIPISDGPSRKGSPAIAFDGANYLVVWADDRNGSWDIYCTLVSPSGEVLSPRGVAVSTARGRQAYPAVAFNGSRYFVVWHDERTDYVNVYGARVALSGSVLDKDGFVIASGIAPEEPPGPGGIAGLDGPWGPKVATDGVGYFVVWQSGWGEFWDIYGARVTGDGSVLDPSGIAVSTSEDADWYPDVTYGSDDYLVVWHAVADGSFDVFGARVSSSGSLLDPNRIAISVHRFWQRFPTAASDGTNFIVTWANWTMSSQDVYMARVDPSGAVLDPEGAPVITAEVGLQWRPAVAFDGTNYLVLCQDERSVSGANVHGVLIDRSGEVVTSEDIVISPKGDGPWGPKAAFDGTNYMVVWGDLDGDSRDIYGARVSAEGVLLNDDAIPISTVPGGQWSPAIAFDGANYMVVWQDDRNGSWDIYGARLRSSGFVFDPAGIHITSFRGQELFPAIAFDGTNYLVVWEDERGGSWDIYGMRMTPSGSVLDPGGVVISAADGMQRHPALAFDGTNYLVVWEDYRAGSGDIYGARVTPDGFVLDSGGLLISADSDAEWLPAISFDGANFLVVWQVWNGGAEDILGARVSPSGAVLDPDRITVSAGNRRQWAPAVAFNGTYHIVTWGDTRNGKKNVDVYAARVSPLGGVLDPVGIGMSTDRDDQLLPAVATDDSGRVLVAHSWLIPSSIFGYWRVWGVTWTPPDEPPLLLTLGVHQNPELTAELDIYLIPSKAVQDTSVHIAVGGVPLEASATDPTGSIYRAGHRLSSSGALMIEARARDLAGVLKETSREFGAGFVSANAGGNVDGPRGVINLRCPGGSVAKDSYILIGPEGLNESRPSVPEELDYSPSQDTPAGAFLLSPPSLALRNAATLTVRLSKEDDYRGADAGGDAAGLRPSLWREGSHEWEPVFSEYDELTETLTASVRSLGRYKVVWGPTDGYGETARVLLGNVPNPFRSVVDVRYHLPQGGLVRVSVYDAEGRLVRTLFEGRRGPGWWSESWNGTDAGGAPLPSGIYFTDLDIGAEHISRKCVLVR